MQLPPLQNADIKGKIVFLRADLDVPIVDGKIEDDYRLLSAIPTIEYLLKQNVKIIIAGHLGRPRSIQNSEKEFSLAPIARWFGQKLKIKNQKSKIGEFEGWEIGQNIFLLENLRFDDGEEKNSPEFAKKLAGLADIYVNDAFAMCHRRHASVIGISRLLPHYAGLHLKKEIENLNRAMNNPERPLVVVVGGKKIETKLPLVEKMHKIADYVLVGGKIAEETKILIKTQHEKITGSKAVLLVADQTADKRDISQKSIENFLQIINIAKTIIWNGSMGIVGGEREKLISEEGTKEIAQGIIKSKAYSIVGGGDTVEYLNRLGILSEFSFVSTGGGAMLSYLSGEKLPGIEALS